ncbi:MAG: hypothetical protein L0H73_00015 [Nitrococcus sp.]|nr:hypothetical protein [Nitrococcus sp.]
MTAAAFDLLQRRGLKPEAVRPSRERPVPHQQLSQTASPDWQEVLFERVRVPCRAGLGVNGLTTDVNAHE